MSYEVIPRYSGGSPAMVDEATALRVARDEKRAYEAVLDGVYGPGERALAKAQGLEGIVLETYKRKADQNFYRDSITGRDYGDVPYTAIRNYEQLTLVRKRGVTKIYFRRDLLGEAIGRKSESFDSGLVAFVRRLLHTKHTMDPWSPETEALWQKRVEI